MLILDKEAAMPDDERFAAAAPALPTALSTLSKLSAPALRASVE
jgi:hypothetical protein